MAATTDRFVDLKVNRNLLDPNFDGYKLSLEDLAVYKVPLSLEIDEVGLSNEQYSYQHIKAYGLNNHLVLDLWIPDSVYFINNKWELVRVCVKGNSAYVDGTMFTIPDAADYRLATGRLNVSFQFVSPTCLVLANGTGKMYFIDTGNRAGKQPWKVTYSDSVLGENQFFTLLNCTSSDGGHKLECLLLHVDEIPECEDKASPVRTVIEWLTFSSSEDNVWSLDRSRRLDGRTTPDYIVVDKTGKSLLMASEKPFKFSYDSESVVDELPDPVDELASGNGMHESPVYTWSQTDEEITVQIPLPPDTVKSDIVYTLGIDKLHLEVKNRDLKLVGEFCGKVDLEGSTWTLGDNVLDLTIAKQGPGSWESFIRGDTQGLAVLDGLQQTALEDLARMVKAEGGGDDDLKKIYNAQELEECDTFPEDTAVMVRIDGETHQVTHQANLSCHQCLFNTASSPQDLPAICLRHDVDGVLWQPKDEYDSKDCPWEHISTFNALGYVQASKQNKKFATCSPDYSYAALSDCTRHVYVYRQPESISTPLRNRKTGRQVAAVAKQQVFSLDNVDQILGLRATNSHVFVCTSNLLYVLAV